MNGSFLKKLLAWFLAAVCAILLIGSGFYLGFSVGENHPKKIVIEDVSNMVPSTSPGVDFATFWQAWQVINDNYLRNASTSGETKLHGAVSGLVRSLGDPYSEYFAPEDSKQFQEDVQGNFGGIGAELGIKKDQLVIIAPLADTPASKAGLSAGDAILAINATSTDGISISKAVRLIRGPIGSTVNLTIMRDGWQKTKDFAIVRANIEIPTIDVSTVGGNITRLELHSFNANAERLFYNAIVKASDAGSKGLILDLRNNPGGYLEVAVDLAGWFLPRGTDVVSEQGRGGVVLQSYKASGNAALADFPVVVLINGGSASASEILAGALQDQRRDIKLVGETSFGKGTVQELDDLNDGSSLKITVAHWVLPSGHILENGGIKPDVEVKMTDEDIEKKRDPQLDKAIEMIKSEIDGSR
ncbi:MAG: S41 family peptidase [Candidatus Liptonbacteria bacterium]|nr:S41 family peptidase [Candidatus Liptonbacteria bacterium]